MNTNNMKKFIFLSIFSLFIFSNFNFVGAQVSNNNSGIGSGSQTTDNTGIGPGSLPIITPSSQNSNFKLQVKLDNPLAKNGINTINDAVKAFMGAIVRIAIPFIVVFFIWSGLSFILARGNEKKILEAKNMFLYTIIGTLLILGAWAITNAIVGTVNSLGS